MRKRLCGALGCFVTSLALGQSSPFVPEKTERLLVNELSGDRAFETLRITTQWHKPSGSEGFFAVARYVEERAKAAGLSDVRWIDQVAETPSWTCHRAEAWLLKGEGADLKETRIGSNAEVPTSIADYSRPADVTAELVDVGPGDAASDYEGKDVRGRIVLAYGNPHTVMEQAVWKRRAAGILSWSSSRLNALADSADQIAWQSVPAEDGPHGEKTTFAFIISARQGKALAERLRGAASQRWGGGAAASAVALRARVLVESAVLPAKKTAMVEARIPGTDPSLPEIVLTSHLQENISANDNQSGVASMLEIGRALTTLIAQGKLPKPRRGIRFWWCDEIYSEYRYFADHPGEEKKILVNLNQDMVGAKQSIGSRTQFMARTPWSRPSFLSDVQESVLNAVVRGNNAYLPAWQTDGLPPGEAFTKPMFSRLGTREPFHAQAVPYFDSTDHLVFNDIWVGVPGTTLTNWPDENIHSSSDDLWQIDPTQLKRNAFVVAATSWWIANATEADVAFLAAFLGARGAERLGRDLVAGQVWMEGGTDERRTAAASLLDVSLARELQTVETARVFGSATGSEPAAIGEAAGMLRGVAASFRTRVAPASPPASDPALVRLGKHVPRYAVTTLDAWMALQHRVAEKRDAERRARRDKDEADAALRKAGKKPKTEPAPAAEEPELSPLMATEAMTWVDGKTDAAEIARRVCAEALSAGHWYYGNATPAMVESFLEKQVKDGLLAW
jgi:Zn-dependent M28 family amino/carboxypeptidase